MWYSLTGCLWEKEPEERTQYLAAAEKAGQLHEAGQGLAESPVPDEEPAPSTARGAAGCRPGSAQRGRQHPRWHHRLLRFGDVQATGVCALDQEQVWQRRQHQPDERGRTTGHAVCQCRCFGQRAFAASAWSRNLDGLRRRRAEQQHRRSGKRDGKVQQWQWQRMQQRNERKHTGRVRASQNLITDKDGNDPNELAYYICL